MWSVMLMGPFSSLLRQALRHAGWSWGSMHRFATTLSTGLVRQLVARGGDREWELARKRPEHSDLNKSSRRGKPRCPSFM